jgi:hypothetical protein
VAAFVLVGTSDVMIHRPMDALSLAWIITAVAVLACVASVLLWIVARPLWQGGGFHDVESLFWIAFLALPLIAWLMYAAIWNLLEWVSGH